MGSGSREAFVQLNMKPLEWARPNKIGRIVCDLTTEASLRGGWLIDLVKKAMALLEDDVRGARIVFVKSPDLSVLSHWFAVMQVETASLYFSDDSVISIRCSDGMLWINMDIASCDASNGSAVFLFLLDFVPKEYRHVIQSLVDQCTMPCRLGVGESTMKFRPRGHFEYSGSLLTTLLNNVSNRTLLALILSHLPFGSIEETRMWLNSYVSKLPWSVTCEFCDRFEQVQFLKCSPCLAVDGTVCAVLNLGVILRCMGQCSWDLPGRGDLEKRAFDFNAGLVRGLVHAGDHEMMRILRAKFGCAKAHSGEGTVTHYNSHIVEFMSPGLEIELSEVSVIARYGCSLESYECFLSLLRVAEYGDVVDCEASRIILDVDYGL